ncbi:MAG TPA: exopolysaccharide biosynthesis protein, partial [Paraburkholderia sp.]|nr:exopolysaccharide biosynthesis protein [Paraburkholderia sp.]
MSKLNLMSALALSAFVSACATAPGNYLDTSSLKEQPSNQPQKQYDVHLIDSQLVMQQAQQAEVDQKKELPPSKYASPTDYTYHLAPQDILGVTVYDHPELSTPQGSTFSTGGN